MDFSDTPEEAEFRSIVRTWLKENGQDLKSTAPEELYTEKDIEACKQWQQKKAAASYAHIVWPKSYGGMGGTWMQAAIFDQEERRLPRPFNYFSVGIGQCLPAIMEFGTEQQKDLIAKTLCGELLWCQLFSEPNAGVDLAAVRTKAIKDGDNWRIDGQKLWTSGAQIADYGILLARTDPNVPKHKGLTFFVVDMRTAGITVKPIKQISGHSEFNEVFFDNVVLSDENRLGEIGQGWGVAMHTLTAERFKRLNTRMPPLSSLLSLVNELNTDDDNAGGGAIQQSFAKILVQKCAQENYMSRMLTTLSKGEELGGKAGILKLSLCKFNQDLAAFSLDLHEQFGLIVDEADDPLRRELYDAYLWSPGLRIAGGSDEILMNIIGERALGLPSGPRLDKGIPFKDIKT